MVWYAYVAWLFAGVFLTNAIPHTVQGLSGNPFPTPFASPPGRGNSPPELNVLWGFFNFIVGGVLINDTLPQHPPPWPLVALALLGALLMALRLSHHFGKVRKPAPRP